MKCEECPYYVVFKCGQLIPTAYCMKEGKCNKKNKGSENDRIV